MIFLLQKTLEKDYHEGKDVRKVPANGFSDNEILKVDGKVVLDDKNRPTFKGAHAATYSAMINGGNFILFEEIDDADPLPVEETTTIKTIKEKKKRVKKHESDQGTGTDSGDSGDSEGGDTDGGTDTED